MAAPLAIAPIPSQVTAILGTLLDPYLDQDLVKAKIVHDVTIIEQQITIKLVYPYPVLRRIPELKQTITALLQSHWPTYQVSLDIHAKIRHHRVQKALKPKSVIKNIIAVASGKGGVGKSTVAVNLAVALSELGASVALLDADIYGPSQPRMLGKRGSHAITSEKKLVPIKSFGIQSISMGYLVEEQTPMIWRGPMVSSALQQLLNDTTWEPCDYMIIDLPPGTGDIQLTMAQKIPISGAVVVTTPQDIALLDAQKAYQMFAKIEVPVLGVVENMSWHICANCGHHSTIFGSGGGEKMAADYGIPLLGKLPLDPKVREQGDLGVPIVMSDPNHERVLPYWELAERVAARLALREVDYSAVMPEIIVHS
ncbi:MAG: iron-sulfur cluster carrier protein ApbC [Candidatus Berkiellales bacterium]